MSRVIKSTALRDRPDLLDTQAIAAIFAARFDLANADAAAREVRAGGELLGPAEEEARADAGEETGAGGEASVTGVGDRGGDAARRAAEILERAREQARAVHLQAAAEGRAQGYAEGLERGRAEARREAAGILEAAGNLARCIAQRERAIVEQAERDVVDLALTAAERIVRKRVREDAEIAVAVVREAVARVSGARQVRVRVSPLELEAVRSRRDEFMELLDAAAALEVVEDPRISPGGCVVETPTGNVDARIEEQIEAVRRTLQDGLEQRGAC